MAFGDLFFTIIVPILSALIVGAGTWWLAAQQGASRLRSLERVVNRQKNELKEKEEEIHTLLDDGEARSQILLRWQEHILRPIRAIIERRRIQSVLPFDASMINFELGELEKIGLAEQEVEALQDANAPVSLDLLKTLGLLRAFANEMSIARVHFQSALAVESTDLDSRANLGTVLLHEQQFEAAAEQFKALAELAANRVEAHLGLGLAHIGSGRAEKAIEALTLAITLQPEDPQIYVELGRAHVLAGDLQRAMDTTAVALKIAPRYMEANLLLQSLLIRSGDFEEAVKQCKRLLARREDGSVRYNLARALARLEENEEALESLRAAIQIDDHFRFRARDDKAFALLADNRRFKDLLEGRPGLF